VSDFYDFCIGENKNEYFTVYLLNSVLS